jgi:GR25 family glycosyltransferase involved in LPS biosynthesis
VILCENWQERYEQAMKDVPADFDVLFLGSCCTNGHKDKAQVRGEIHWVKHAQCLHAYVVAKKAIGTMIDTLPDWFGPVDCLLVLNTFPQLKVYAALPRLADQLNTEISP